MGLHGNLNHVTAARYCCYYDILLGNVKNKLAYFMLKWKNNCLLLMVSLLCVQFYIHVQYTCNLLEETTACGVTITCSLCN